MLYIVTWLWGSKWPASYAEKLFAGISQNLKQPHRCVLMSDKLERNGADAVHLINEADEPLLTIPGCLARIRMFDKNWQERIGAKDEDKIVNIDLDTVITGPLDLLFNRNEPFVILQGANASNPCPMNGALMMIRAGAHPEVWKDFNLDAVNKVPFHSFPDDQNWIWHKVPDAAGWRCGKESGVYVFRKPGWPSYIGNALPKNTRLVTFINRDPSQLMHLDWVKEHWHA